MTSCPSSAATRYAPAGPVVLFFRGGPAVILATLRLSLADFAGNVLL